MYKLMNVWATVHEPGSSSRPITVHVQDLSATGGCFVTRGYVHPQASVAIQLPTLAIGECIDAVGSVSGCAHLRGMEHMLAVVFNEAIDVAAVTAVIAEKGEKRSPSGPLGELSVLLVDAQSVDRELLGQRLGAFQLCVVDAAHAGAAIDLLKTRRFDVLLMDEELEDESGLDALTRIRDGIFLGPVVMLTTSTSVVRHREMIERGASVVLIKPATPLLIAQVLREVVTEGGSIGVDRALPQILEASLFERASVASLLEEMGRVREMIRASHGREKMIRACRTIAGAAASVGLTLLGRAADRAAVALECGVTMDSRHICELDAAIEASAGAIRRAAQGGEMAAA